MDNTQLNLIIAIGTVLSSILSIWGILTRFSDKLEKRFDKIEDRFDKMDQRFEKTDLETKNGFEKTQSNSDQGFKHLESKINKLQEDMSDVRERLSFVEACTVYSMPTETVHPNPRSQAMIEHHRRRRQKKLEQKH